MEPDSLTLFGLSETESRIYMEILVSEAPSASEIRHTTRISKPTLYAALKRLCKAGLVNEAGENPKRYTIVSPGALKIFSERHEKDKNEKLKNLFDEITSIWEKKSKHYCILSPKEFILGRFFLSNGEGKIKEIIDSAQTEILIDDLPFEYMDLFRTNLIKASERGVKIILGIPDEDIFPKMKRSLSGFTAYFKEPIYPCFDFDGMKVRSALILSDRKIFGTIYHSPEKIMFSYMNSPGCIDCIKGNLMKGYEVRFPKKKNAVPREESLILMVLRKGNMSKRELSRATGLSGSRMNKALTILSLKDCISIRRQGRKEIVSLPQSQDL